MSARSNSLVGAERERHGEPRSGAGASDKEKSIHSEALPEAKKKQHMLLLTRKESSRGRTRRRRRAPASETGHARREPSHGPGGWGGARIIGSVSI